MTPPEGMERARGPRPSEPTRDAPWMSRTPWGAVCAGALAGFAALVLMGTLGVALGITARAVAVANSKSSAADMAEKVSSAFGFGPVTWTLLTAVVVGLVGGWALNRTARGERSYFAFTFGSLTWAAGVFLALLVAVPGWAGLMAGIGASSSMENRPMAAAPGEKSILPLDPALKSEEERQDRATQRAKAAAWILLSSQVISLASTILAASWRRPTRPKIQTEIRLRPAPTA